MCPASGENSLSDSLANSALEGIGMGILVTDQEGQVIQYNKYFAKLWQLPPSSQLNGEGFALDRLSEQVVDPLFFVERIAGLIKHQGSDVRETVALIDGRILEWHIRPVILAGDKTARLWSFEDVTINESARKALNQETGFRNSVIKSLPDLIWMKDPDGIFLACNKRFEDFYGAQESDILGKSDYDFVDASVANSSREYDRKAVLNGAPSVNEEWVTFASDGHSELLETTRTPIFDDAGLLVGVLGIGHDITQRKRAETFDENHASVLEMIATGRPAPEIYDAIALMYEARHKGMKCSMLELHDGVLSHGGAPSLPQAYCEGLHGLKNGPEVGSCGTSTYTGNRVLVEDIATDPKWAQLKDLALAHNLRCCWSEPIKSSLGEVLGAFGMYYDHPALPDEEESSDLRSAARLAGIVMERDQAQKRIRELAYTDELTGLSSRASFSQKLKEIKRICDRYERRFGLLYIDLDDFKSVNDSLGHDAGDKLLKEVASRLLNVGRNTDHVARLGGDEFCIIVGDVEDEYTTARVAQRCLEEISRPIDLLTRKVTPSCSIGVAHYPEDGKDISALLKAADTSLYAAKENGKNQFAFYTPQLTSEAEHRFLVERNLRDAVEEQQFSLVYQPQINIKTGEIVGVEALSRWNNQLLGKVPPVEFVATAEKIGMIKPLTEWVLKTACEQAVAFKQLGVSNFRMSVNISPQHFLDEDIVSLVRDTLEDTGVDPGELVLEVTESVVQTDEHNLAIFRALKELGVKIAIDDFGSGYSSFASLKYLILDSLKIDRIFVDDMVSDNRTQLLIDSMIGMGQNLGLEVIAEGVQTKSQLTMLESFGCEVAQGFMFLEPVNAEALTSLITKNTINGHVWWPGFAKV